ncbi:MAG: hypothetical protein EZS28_012145 [Streblomastix strix]|uniref:Uncharacterized protein n=1 Tax=Streblomastix strix TaxID=222440 RepID=A0A5J4WBK2_9EUKA|nr:MAG: hypothetical protein EZS28_012145 [Streblomastix strix]
MNFPLPTLLSTFLGFVLPLLLAEIDLVYFRLSLAFKLGFWAPELVDKPGSCPQFPEYQMPQNPLLVILGAAEVIFYQALVLAVYSYI